MRKGWLVAKHEYLTMVRRRGFLLGTVGIPLLIVAVAAFSVFLAVGNQDQRPLGYVDLAGVLSSAPAWAGAEDSLVITPFANRESAEAALKNEAIQAFFLVPGDYLQTGRVQLFFLDQPPGGEARRRFDDLLRAGLLARQSEAVQRRLEQGIDLTVRADDGSRQFAQDDVLSILLPFAAGFLFVFAVLSSTGYLLQAVTTEKENRTVEIMATSLSPLQFIGGKAIGLLVVALTQIATWVAAAAVGLIVGARFIPELQGLSLPWGLLAIAALYFLTSYALMAGLMIAVGSMVTELRHGQQIAGLLNLLFVLPFFFAVMVFTDPDSPLLVALTLFPTTSFLTVLLRWSATAIPLWQLLLSWVILMATAALTIWIASRIFRVGMLRYGQPLDLRRALAVMRTGTG